MAEDPTVSRSAEDRGRRRWWTARGGSGRRRGRQRKAAELPSARRAGSAERGGPETERAAQAGKWPCSPPSASPSSEKTGLRGTAGTSGSRSGPQLTLTPPPAPNAFHPHPFSSPLPAPCVCLLRVSNPAHPPPHPASSDPRG